MYTSGVYYGDASGGEYTKYPEIRRVGCAFAKIDDLGSLTFAASFPLPGEIQTVSRGELFSLVEFMKHVEPMSEIEFVTDNKGVKDKFEAGPKSQCRSSNCDLFHELYQITIRKAVRLRVRWMPSHLKLADERPADVSQLDIIGDSFADKFAGEAADSFKVSLQVALDCKYYYWLTKAIQKRIIAVIKALPERNKITTVRTPREIQQSLDDKVNESNLVLSQNGDRYTCQLVTALSGVLTSLFTIG